ncbi:hypothetical protein Fmac_009588 [Flemingia macrophylla]|uniref:Pectinesterase inhibitor domain-containing protein n=1 Tax=Flemingia macrophylla TaxID=520843 RepID=A0ABD1N0S2_9FABA
MFSLRQLSLLCSILIVAIISLPACHCRVLEPNDVNLIKQTCQKTPNPNLCNQILQADPRGRTADVSGLALILVDAIKAKANGVYNKINNLIKGGGNKKALSSCADKYKTILVADVPQATQALQTGNAKFAEDAASDSAIEASSCEHGFGGKSPLTLENNACHYRVSKPNDVNLIKETCKKTPNPNLCVKLLEADPRGSTTDVTGLALILVYVIKVRANEALTKINKLIKRGGDKKALSSCADKYKTILVADVPQASQALQFGNPKFAEDATSDSVVEATSCEDSFNGKSPLTNENNASVFGENQNSGRVGVRPSLLSSIPKEEFTEDGIA